MAVAEPVVAPAAARSRPLRIPLLNNRLANRAAASLFVLATAIAVLAPVLAPHDPLAPAGIPLRPPGEGGFLLGTDSVGRDVLSRLISGWQLSWFAALAVVASGLLVGGIVGTIAGALGGWVDLLLMRVTDGFLALPAPVLAIAVVAALGPGVLHTLLAVSVVWWPFYARIVRGEIRTLAARPHVEAARMAGVSPFRIAWRHLLPGAVPAAVVTASLDIGNLVLTLAGLSFLGLGQPAPAPELGADTARNLQYLLQQWWIPVMPGIAVLLMTLVGNLAGDGVRNLMDEN
jgi:peptide/nickel transport system permease protein